LSKESEEFELHKLQLEHKFQAAKLADEHALEREKLDRQHKFEARKEYARQILEYSLQHDRHLKDYGQMGLRSVFLLNGAAIIALLTFIGSAAGKLIGKLTITPALFVPAFSFFAVGRFCATVAITFSYFNYMGHKHTNADPGWLTNNIIAGQEQWPAKYSLGTSRFINWTWRLALITGVGGLMSFGLGCYKVACVFQSLG
jgi:hypothetical protein